MDRCKIIQGDCLGAIHRGLHFPAPEKSQLTYIDPPFFSGRDYETRDGVPAFSDKWESREVYKIGSQATGLDLEKLCFETPLEQLVDTEVQQPALVAHSVPALV